MKIKTLLIGLGRIASLLEIDKFRYHPCTHAGVLLSTFGKKHFQLSAIYDSNPERIKDFYKQWKLNPKQICSNLKEIENDSFDLAIIASSSEAHFENIKFAVSLGIKNLLIEKPICLNTKELKKIITLRDKYNLKIWVNHERRYHYLYRYVKDLIQSKKYGNLRTIKASVLTSFRDPGIAFTKGGGPLLHDGTHAVDYIDYLLESKPISIESKLIKANPTAKIEEQALAFISYPENVFAFLEAGGKRNYFQFEIDVQTENARFVLSNDGHHFFETTSSKLYKGFKSLKELPLPKIPKNERNPWINLYKEIINVIKNNSEIILGSLDANIRIYSTIDQIYKKSRSLPNHQK